MIHPGAGERKSKLSLKGAVQPRSRARCINLLQVLLTCVREKGPCWGKLCMGADTRHRLFWDLHRVPLPIASG